MAEERRISDNPAHFHNGLLSCMPQYNFVLISTVLSTYASVQLGILKMPEGDSALSSGLSAMYVEWIVFTDSSLIILKLLSEQTQNMV
jgi:hypothetical protein